MSGNRRNPRAKWVLPDVLHPRDTVCYRVHVPNNKFYIAAFNGAILNLASAVQWQDDPAHTAKVVARVWRDIYDALKQEKNCDCEPIPSSSDYGCGDEDCMCCLKFENGFLMQLSCGVWEKVPGQPEGGWQAPSQPGDGSPQPIPGGCQTYHASMNGGGLWYLPTVVSENDTIQITLAMGATNDGVHSRWNCPDGNQFFGGACVPYTSTDGSNPLPSVYSGKIIAKIGSTFYDVFSGVAFTVPSGHTSDPVTFQCNYASLTGAQGDLTFDVNVCYAASDVWTSEVKYDLDPYGVFTDDDYGLWEPGTGYTGVVNGAVPHYVQLTIPVLDSCIIDSLTMKYDSASVGGSGAGILFEVNGSLYDTAGVPSVGTNLNFGRTSTVTGVTSILMLVDTGTTGGADAIRRLIVSGHGPKPSQLP